MTVYMIVHVTTHMYACKDVNFIPKSVKKIHVRIHSHKTMETSNNLHRNGFTEYLHNTAQCITEELYSYSKSQRSAFTEAILVRLRLTVPV